MKKPFRPAAMSLVLISYLALSAGIAGVIFGVADTPSFSFSAAEAPFTGAAETDNAGAAAVFATSDEEIFVLRETDGKIGVFRGGDCLRVLDVFVFTLPDGIRERLQSGIECDAEGLLYLTDALTS